VADPGFALARDAAGAGYTVTTAPGASAALAALSLSGLPSDRFLFAGFAPTAKGARRRWLEEVTSIPATQIIFESPKRIGRLLTDLCEIAGAERNAAVCRELTKKFEEIKRGRVSEILAYYEGKGVKGEFIVII